MATPRPTALVTGTSKGGIGDYLARELHQRGYRVFATARSPQKVKHLAEMGIEIIELDVTQSESVKQAAENVGKLTGQSLNVLINNSGIGYKSAILDVDCNDARRVLDTNLWGVIEVTQAFMPMLLITKGTVVNIGSISGKIPLLFQGIYGMSKAALDHLSKQMRLELRPLGIEVIHVVAGAIKTDFFANAGRVEFPETSLYWPGREYLTGWLNGDQAKDQMPSSPDVFARQVIDNITKGSPSSCQWAGRGATLVWSVTTLLWRNATDLLLWASNMPNVKRAIAASKKLE